MDLGSLIVSAVVFYAFVPGVLMKLPAHGSKATVLVVHAVLFALVASLAMRMYHGMRESMSNYGKTCPNGYAFGLNQAGEKDCVPVGGPTYSVTAAIKS